jgi:hypothetical protein
LAAAWWLAVAVYLDVSSCPASTFLTRLVSRMLLTALSIVTSLLEILQVYPVFLLVPIVLLVHDARHVSQLTMEGACQVRTVSLRAAGRCQNRLSVRIRVGRTALEIGLFFVAWLLVLLWLSFLAVG